MGYVRSSAAKKDLGPRDPLKSVDLFWKKGHVKIAIQNCVDLYSSVVFLRKEKSRRDCVRPYSFNI